MEKELSEMSLSELWELFPIYLTEHKACWEGWFLEEKNILKKLLNDKVDINHIGSTAIKSIWAKPIIDILLQASKSDFAFIKDTLMNNGYICMAEGENKISFNKGYTRDGFAERVFHLHLKEFGDDKEMFFCKYLNENPIIAKDYEKLKIALWKKYPNNRDAYTEAKSDFINEYTEKAIKIYQGNIL